MNIIQPTNHYLAIQQLEQQTYTRRWQIDAFYWLRWLNSEAVHYKSSIFVWLHRHDVGSGRQSDSEFINILLRRCINRYGGILLRSYHLLDYCYYSISIKWLFGCFSGYQSLVRVHMVEIVCFLHSHTRCQLQTNLWNTIWCFSFFLLAGSHWTTCGTTCLSRSLLIWLMRPICTSQARNVEIRKKNCSSRSVAWIRSSSLQLSIKLRSMKRNERANLFSFSGTSRPWPRPTSHEFVDVTRYTGVAMFVERSGFNEFHRNRIQCIFGDSIECKHNNLRYSNQRNVTSRACGRLREMSRHTLDFVRNSNNFRTTITAANYFIALHLSIIIIISIRSARRNWLLLSLKASKPNYTEAKTRHTKYGI